MRNKIKKVVFLFAKPLFQWYFSKKRVFRYRKVWADVLPEVFSPHFILSTRILLDFISKLKLNEASFLELGCGSATIATYAAMQGAAVTASDINPKAVENANINAQKHGIKMNVYASDLFDAIPAQSFDYIVINPPYYPKSPANMQERAWYCGENFEYFDKLYRQIQGYITHKSKVYMILSEDCELEKIIHMAVEHQLEVVEIERKKRWFEENYIFQISGKNKD